MKRCQKCSRTYPDENQKFCTFDGGLLLHEQPRAATFDPNLTVRATSKELTPPTDANLASEAPTSVQLPNLDRTMATFGTGQFSGPEPPPTSGQTASDLVDPMMGATVELSSVNVPPPPPPASFGSETVVDFAVPELPAAPAPPVPPAADTASGETATLTAPPSTVPPPTPAQPAAPPAPPAPKQKRSVMPLVLVGVAVLLLVGGGAAGAGYFFWLKPFLATRKEKQAVVLPSRTPDQNPNTNPSSSPTPDTNPNTAPSPGPEAFVPPAGSVKFVNSKDALDGKLAEHYLDFSLYYLESWERDPNAGVAGASNFVSVGRKLPPNFPQESCAIGWYASKGTFALDRDDFARLVEQVSSNYAKNFSNYRKVSEGPTKVNSLDAYEFRFESLSQGTDKGDIKGWGRVIFLPSGVDGEKSGVTLFLFATSLAPELAGVDDVGVKGELPLILQSFRFGTGH